MPAVGGDLTEITYNNPDVGAGVLFVKAAEDSDIDLGGLRNDDDANGIDGGGNLILSKKRVRWMFPATVSWDMNNNSEMEKLVALAESNNETEFTFGHINGTIYRGTGVVVGDLKGSTQNATIAITFSGGGKLKKL